MNKIIPEGKWNWGMFAKAKGDAFRKVMEDEVESGSEVGAKGFNRPFTPFLELHKRHRLKDFMVPET